MLNLIRLWRSKRTHKGFRALRWLGRVLFYPLFFMLLLSAILVSTSPGTQLLTLVANQWDALELDYKSGQLNQRLELHSFKLDLGFLQIQAQQVAIEWNPWCTVQNKLCIRQLDAQSLDLKLLEREPNSKESAAHSHMQLPFAIDIKQATIKQGHLEIYDLLINWQQALAGLLLKGDQIRVDNAEIDTISVHVHSSDKVTKPSQPWLESDWPLAHVPQTYLPLRLQLPQVQSKSLALKIGAYPWDHFSHVLVKGQWQMTEVLINRAEFEHNRYGALSLQGEAQLLHPYPMTLKARAQPKALPGFSSLQGSDWQLSLAGSMDGLHLIANENKTLHWQTEGQIQFSDYQMPFSIRLKGEEMIWPDTLPHWLEYQKLTGEIAGDRQQQAFNLEAEVKRQVHKVTLHSKVTAKGSHQAKKLSLDWLKADYLNQEGGVQASGWIDYNQGLSWQAELNLSHTLLPEIEPLDQIELTGHLASKGYYGDNSWELDFSELALLGRYKQEPVELLGRLKVNDQRQGEAIGFVARYGDSQLQLNGKVDKNWQLEGELSSSNLTHLHPELAGDVRFDISASGPREEPKFQAEGSSRQLNYGPFKGLDLSLSANYQPAKEHLFQFIFNTPKARLAKIPLENISLTGEGDLTSHQLELRSEGELLSQLQLHGQLDKEFSHWQGQITEAMIGSHGGLWQLHTTPWLKAKLRQPELVIAPHCWQSPRQSSICFEQGVNLSQQGSLELSLSLEAQDLSPYLLPDDYTLSGLLSGKGIAAWSPTEPLKLKANLETEQIQVNHHNLVKGDIKQTALEHLQLELDLNRYRSKLLLDMASSAEDGIWLDAQLQHNQARSLSGLLQIHNYELGRFRNLFPDLSKVQGLLNGRLELSGQQSTPELEGWLQLKDGKLTLLSNPTPVNQLELDARFNKAKALVSSQFSVGGGQASLVADVDWHKELTASANLKGNSLGILLPPQSSLSLSPDLLFTYNEGQPLLTGKIYMPQAKLKLKSLSNEGIELSDDVVFVDDFEQEKSAQQHQLTTNIELQLGREVELDAFNIKGRLEGNMAIQQSLGNPVQLFGQTSFHDAKFAAYGQRLTIEDNSSLFFNGEPMQANLNMRASRLIKNENVTAGIALSGTLRRPRLNFFSEPAMEQQEVLSYLVRGKGFRDTGLSNSEATAATVGVSAISSLGLHKPLEKLPGISDVSFDTEGEGDETQVTISGFLGERLFLKYGIGVFEPINEVTVRFYLMNQLWLESVTGLEKSLDLYYSFFIE